MNVALRFSQKGEVATSSATKRARRGRSSCWASQYVAKSPATPITATSTCSAERRSPNSRTTGAASTSWPTRFMLAHPLPVIVPESAKRNAEKASNRSSFRGIPSAPKCHASATGSAPPTAARIATTVQDDSDLFDRFVETPTWIGAQPAGCPSPRLYALVVRRFLIWSAAIAIAVLVGMGVSTVVDVRGRVGLLLVTGTLVVQAVVAALVVTALDSLFPAGRRLRRS